MQRYKNEVVCSGLNYYSLVRNDQALNQRLSLKLRYCVWSRFYKLFGKVMGDHSLSWESSSRMIDLTN